jgi:hypothetical protein
MWPGFPWLLWGATFAALLASPAIGLPHHERTTPPRAALAQQSQTLPQRSLNYTVAFPVEDGDGNFVHDLTDDQVRLFVYGYNSKLHLLADTFVAGMGTGGNFRLSFRRAVHQT